VRSRERSRTLHDNVLGEIGLGDRLQVGVVGCQQLLHLSNVHLLLGSLHNANRGTGPRDHDVSNGIGLVLLVGDSNDSILHLIVFKSVG